MNPHCRIDDGGPARDPNHADEQPPTDHARHLRGVASEIVRSIPE